MAARNSLSVYFLRRTWEQNFHPRYLREWLTWVLIYPWMCILAKFHITTPSTGSPINPAPGDLCVGLDTMIVVRRFFTGFFSTPSEPFSRWGIIAWWEIRRVPYNLIVGVFGAISLFFFFVFIGLAHEPKPGEDAIEPMALFVAPIAVNICYTGGWIVELLLSFVRPKGSAPIGPGLLKLGVGFSLAVVLLPSALWFMTWVARRI
jgi:hypothetical protein